MEFLGVLVAAVASFAFGAFYYGALSKPWMEASGVPIGEDGKPVGASNPVPYIVSFICILLVAGMMRHAFAMAGIASVGKGAIGGLGIGLFFIAPWIFLNTGYSARPWKLAVIDSGYAVATGLICGIVLTLI